MKPTMPATGDGQAPEPADFSFVLGGPLFQLLRRAHLTDDGLLLVRRRIVVLSLIAWLPLLVLSVLGGRFLPGSSPVPFLKDIEVHVRFLVAMPLLIGAELLVHSRLRPVAKQFRGRHLIPAGAVERFEAAIASASRLRNSVLGEVLLIAIVYVVGVSVIWRPLDTPTWYATPSVDGFRLTLAGRWYGYVSLPFFQFLLVRWFFRVFIWARLLWQVSRIELNLVPTHPDRVGGLGFLSNTVAAFVPLAAAEGALLSGQIANHVFYLQAALPDFKLEIGVVVVFMLILAPAPLLLFAPQLAQARRKGILEYGALAQRYVHEFEAKWLRGGAPAGEPLLGSGDIQTLGELDRGYEAVRTMGVVPITKQAVLLIVAATLAPIAPLALTMMPLEKLVRTLLRVLF